MARILVVEDERPINELICRNLRLVGHTTASSFDGVDALAQTQRSQPDLVILDVMLPGLTGFEVKGRMDTDIPVIFVTAKDGLNSRLEGLGLGADDYITKPFEILELLARVEAVLRRASKLERTFRHGDVLVDLDGRRVFVGDDEAPLTPKEFDLLEVLIRNCNFALSRERLLELVWGYDFVGETRTVDMHILRLRKKLAWEDTIQTVYKRGYRLDTRTGAGR